MTVSQTMPTFPGSASSRFPADRRRESVPKAVQEPKLRAQEAGRHLTNRLMADMDPELLAFLRTKANSFIKWDLIHFFNENRCATDTAENIARYVGRDVTAVEKALQELAAERMLCSESLRRITVYSLADTPREREMFHHFIEASKDRQFRAKAIYHMLRNLR